MNEIVLTPDYEATAAYFAEVLADHGFEKGALDPALSLVEQAGYLAATDPAAFNRLVAGLRAKADRRNGGR